MLVRDVSRRFVCSLLPSCSYFVQHKLTAALYYSTASTSAPASTRNHHEFIHIHTPESWKSDILAAAHDGLFVSGDFISEAEENLFLKEAEPKLKRFKYEKEHTDDAIYMYRETEKKKWKDEVSQVIERVQTAAFPADSKHLSYIHVLDLAEDGYIRPHIDNERYCGQIIAGLSLLSASVMRLVHKNEPSHVVDLLLNPRSLYILRGTLRYDFTHEILSKAESTFRSTPVPRGRRISIMIRDMPKLTMDDFKIQFQKLPEEDV